MKQSHFQPEAGTSTAIYQNSSASSSSASASSHDEIDENYLLPRRRKPTCSISSERKKLLTPAVMSALDRARLSNRDATLIFSATSYSLGHDVKKISLSKDRYTSERKRCNKI